MKDIYWKGHTILLLISLLCCFPDFVYAYSLRQFSNKNGLSNSAIQSLYQDSQGVLWIGTCDGLNVFDGNNIHLYTPVDVSRNLLSGNIISQIVESEPGILWLQTNYGLDRLDTYRQTCRTFTEFKDNIFLARSKNKCMLVLKDDGNLYHYQQENQKFLQLNISSMDFNKVLSMTIDSNNLLWIFATGNNTRCYRLNHTGKSVTLIPEKPFGHHGLKHAFIGEDSAYFIDETYALYEYSFSNRQCYYIADLKDEIEKRGEVSSIIKRENDFCIGFKSSGLIVLKYEANQKIKYRIEYTEIQSGIFCLMKDKFQDIVWVATDGEGLYMLYNDTFTMTNTLLNTPAYQVNNPVRSLYLDPQQTLWIGTKGSGILRIPNYLVNNTPEKHDRLITGNSTLTDNSVYCFAPGGKDRLWIGTENGINYYSYSTHQLKELAVQANGTKVKYVHSIDQTNDSTLWISTVGEGIVKVTLENQRKDPIVKHATRTLVSNGHMASNYFFTSYRESSSTLWFGNRGLGAYRIDVRTGEMAQFRFNNLVNSQTANDVFAIHKNEQGYWLGTGSGLLRFYSNEDGNPDSISAKLYTNSTVHGILEDNRGNLWVSTNQGLMRLNPQEQTKQTYNNGNGLAVTEFSDGAFYKDNATGILFFGGVNGFVTVKPDSYITTDYMPEISLKGLSIFGKEYNLHDFLHYKNGKPVLQLDYKHNFFQLNFRITDYINGNDYFYSYKLKEASDQWIENGVSPNAIFSNLFPGEYTLFVKYRNNINGKESHPQAFTIYIVPPWYLSTWAYVGYFLLGLLLCTGIVAYAFYTYRLKRQHMMKKMERQKKEEVYESKLRFFTNITHDHLDYHKTFAEYIRAKKLFFDSLAKDAFALTNADDKNGRVMVQNTAAGIHTYSLRTMADFRCKIVEMHVDGMLLRIDGQEVWVGLVGRFNAYNLLAVYGAAVLLGLDRTEVLRAMSMLHAVSGRFEFVRAENGTTAIVDYAHTPDALENVIQTIEEIRTPAQQLIVVCGCGGDRDRTKRPEMAQIAVKYADTAIFTSDNPRHESPGAILDEMAAGLDPGARFLRIVDRAEAIRTAAMLSRPGDILLIAGKGHETYQIIGDVKHHFDDKEEVAKAFGTLRN